MIRSFDSLWFQDKHRAWMAARLAEMPSACRADLEWWAMLWSHVAGCVPLADAARAELRRREALEAEEPLYSPGGPIARQEAKRSQIQRILDACPRGAAEAVPRLGDAIAVIAGLVGESVPVTLAHVLRNHASTSEAISALSVVERLRAEAS